MNILFITLADIRSIDDNGIYTDLMREFAKKNHNIYIVSPIERRNGIDTHMLSYGEFEDWHKNVQILKIKTGNIQKTNVIEKGISTVFIEYIVKYGIKKYFNEIKFDLILYSTPPITLVSPIKYIKKRDNARTYLMLKDIFPQNAVDLGMMTTTGLKGLLYKFFRQKEKKLYDISDRIGCMSQANVDYVLKHNYNVANEKVEICPNCIEVQDITMSDEEKNSMRHKYGIPLDKKVFVYGGNLGKPQGIPFIIDCLKSEKENQDIFFLIVGSGTEYDKLKMFVENERPQNVKLMKSLPKEEYDRMVASCDVGLIFLDNKFTIPNFPSRLLSYMQVDIPVFACTDMNTDIGRVIVNNQFGWWIESSNIESFKATINLIMNTDLIPYGKRANEYLCTYYSVNVCVDNIIRSVYKESENSNN